MVSPGNNIDYVNKSNSTADKNTSVLWKWLLYYK